MSDQKDSKSPSGGGSGGSGGSGGNKQPPQPSMVWTCRGVYRQYQMGVVRPAPEGDGKVPLPTAADGTKAFGYDARFWPSPTILTIGLLPTSDWGINGIWTIKVIQNLVQTHWFNKFKDCGLNICCKWLDNPLGAMVRFQFVTDSADTYSQIGTKCLEQTDQTKPTTVIGILGLEDDKKAIEALILHEFGHVLGFEHEHQHPQRPFTWNETVVLADPRFRPSAEDKQNDGTKVWTPARIKEQILDSIEKGISKTGAEFYDPESIMHYDFPATWIKDGVSEWKTNVVPSVLDLASLWDKYPPDPKSFPAGKFPINPYAAQIEEAKRKTAALKAKLNPQPPASPTATAGSGGVGAAAPTAAPSATATAKK